MIKPSRTLRQLTVVFAAALLLAAPLRAQDASLATASSRPVPAAVEAPPAPVGPTLATASVAVRQSSADANAAPASAAAGGQGRGTALMVVGGAAVLVGLVIGNGAGNAIAVGGAVVGLYGLYQYLQ